LTAASFQALDFAAIGLDDEPFRYLRRISLSTADFTLRCRVDALSAFILPEEIAPVSEADARNAAYRPCHQSQVPLCE